MSIAVDGFKHQTTTTTYLVNTTTSITTSATTNTNKLQLAVFLDYLALLVQDVQWNETVTCNGACASTSASASTGNSTMDTTANEFEHQDVQWNETVTWKDIDQGCATLKVEVWEVCVSSCSSSSSRTTTSSTSSSNSSR